MCIEGFRVEEARGRPRLPLPRGVSCASCGSCDSCSKPSSCRHCSAGSAGPAPAAPAAPALIASVPVAKRGREWRQRTRTELSARGRATPANPPALTVRTPAAGVLANMEAAAGDHRHPAVPPVGRQPSPDEIAAARARLMERLEARSAAAKKTVSSSAAPQQDLHHLDLLASVTAKFSVLLHRLGDALETAQRSHYYSVLSRTTQPAHLVAFVSVALVAALLFPHHGTSPAPTPATPAGPSPWTYLVYVVAFAAHFGAQFWMTFVSGLSLFFSLPRHHFAAVQKVLFPLYFAINAALSLVTLSAFVRLQPPASRWDAEVAAQVAGMVLCFLLELLVRLYLTPPLLHLITAKTEMEKTVEGVGEEVGRYDLGPLTQCPHYVRIHRAFRKVHATIAAANIAAMACTALHAHYLAGKICV